MPQKKLIGFPPTQNCPVCGTKLRFATKGEIQADLNNPEYQHIAEQAAQGDLNWTPPEDWSDWEKDVSPPGSWLMRCNTCDFRLLWSPSEEK
ncbi:MAG: hypothetical protein ACHP8B_10825 [Terriglobales bacterium]